MGYIIVIVNETSQPYKFTIYSNIVHYLFIKSKQVTRSVLVSEIYRMVTSVDIAYAIATIVKMITDQLDLPTIPTIVCIDLYLLYKCLVKLGTTKEKRLIIDIMVLQELYKHRELYEIQWINRQDNPTDAMTKSNANRALETLIDTNSLTIHVEGWVKRDETS